MNRRRPLRLAFTDGLLVAASWALYYHWRYGTWPGPSRGPLLVVLCWLLLHYLLGTYADLSGRQLQLGRQLRNDLLAAAGVMLLAVGFTGLSGGSFASTMGRSFLPVVLVLAVAIGQLLRLGQDLAHLWSPQQQWLLIAAPTERDVLARELEQRGCAVPCGIEWRAASGLAPLPPGLPGLLQLDGVAIGGAVVPSAADRQTLLQWQSQGVRLLALSGWCELFLRRLPPELVPERWSSRVEGFGLSRTGPSARLKRLGDAALVGGRRSRRLGGTAGRTRRRGRSADPSAAANARSGGRATPGSPTWGGDRAFSLASVAEASRRRPPAAGRSHRSQGHLRPGGTRRVAGGDSTPGDSPARDRPARAADRRLRAAARLGARSRWVAGR